MRAQAGVVVMCGPEQPVHMWDDLEGTLRRGNGTCATKGCEHVS
jgi:hypothetical protein